MTDEIRDRLWNEFVERGEPFLRYVAKCRWHGVRSVWD